MNASLRLHAGHALLALLTLLALFLGWRAFHAATAPLPAMPQVAPPHMTDAALLARFDPFFRTAATGGELPVTALAFSLHGLRLDGATGRGSAIIALADGQQAVYSVGDTLADGVTLAAIAIDHVVIVRGGTREALWLDSGSRNAPAPFTSAPAPGEPAELPGANEPAPTAPPPQQAEPQ